MTVSHGSSLDDYIDLDYAYIACLQPFHLDSLRALWRSFNHNHGYLTQLGISQIARKWIAYIPNYYYNKAIIDRIICRMIKSSHI